MDDFTTQAEGIMQDRLDQMGDCRFADHTEAKAGEGDA